MFQYICICVCYTHLLQVVAGLQANAVMHSTQQLVRPLAISQQALLDVHTQVRRQWLHNTREW